MHHGRDIVRSERRATEGKAGNVAVDFSGQRVLVTGASSGIGAGLAEEFARRGSVVGICARREARLAEVLERCRSHTPGARMWLADLADPAAVDELAVSALKELGGVDVLVNNAGIPKRRHVTRLDPATVESVMNINYLSPVRLTLALLPHMVEKGRGRIVNVSSVAATLSSPGEAAYDASKAALTAFSEAMAIDVWQTGIRVLVVYPGLVDTELFSLPDNDPVVASVEAIPVSQLVAAVFDALDRDAVQVYEPGWFADVAAGKAGNLEGFLSGAAQFVAQQASKS
jgi:NAD(P)-dependent dehydrogenase (short-subunit alcohol dehydrogenase family)